MNSSLVVRLYSVHSLLSKLFFFLPIIVIWFRDQGFSQFQVTLIMSSFFLSATVSEIPSGIFSDKYGYRRALFITGILEAAGIVLIANADHFITALIGEVLNGIGYAFYTGSKESYLFHFLTVQQEGDTYQKRFARAKLFEFIGMAAGGLVGGSIYIYWKELPFYLSAVSFIASSLLILYLPTVRQGASDSISSLSHLRQGIEHIRTGPRDLKRLLGFYCVYLSSMLIFLVTLNQPYLRESGIPLSYFGLAFLGFHLCSMGGSEVARHLPSQQLTRRLFFFIGLGLAGGIMALGFFRSPFSILLIFGIHFLWGLFFPVTSQATNQLIDSRWRGTVLATQDFVQNLLFVVLAPILGWITDEKGLPTALWLLGVFAGLTLLFSLKMKLRRE